ncbi:MAG: hypothetical protein JWQ43_2721 [Glaciihabitans sp.]|nr:hypothetical protein [Glaciihabitans sp.]
MTSHVDGNSLAGPLSEWFSIDMTDASGECAGCGAITVLARAMVYPDPMGLVVRCDSCDTVLLAVVHTPAGACIDLRGLNSLRFQR